MKVRTQHVSNSSTSSYLVIGFHKEDIVRNQYRNNLEALMKKANPDVEYWRIDDVIRNGPIGLPEYFEGAPDNFGAGIQYGIGDEEDDLDMELLSDTDVRTELAMNGIDVQEEAKARIFVFTVCS